MRLMFKSRAGAKICDWESYAVLRDNVQHFLRVVRALAPWPKPP